jgi:hypothetical protein
VQDISKHAFLKLHKGTLLTDLLKVGGLGPTAG